MHQNFIEELTDLRKGLKIKNLILLPMMPICKQAAFIDTTADRQRQVKVRTQTLLSNSRHCL